MTKKTCTQLFHEQIYILRAAPSAQYDSIVLTPEEVAHDVAMLTDGVM
jgi:hypothetical protein